jgi:hypothetical protein
MGKGMAHRLYLPQVKKDFRISERGFSLAAKSLLITGLGRSGTTLIGRIISSCDSVEYSFEPPLLVVLFSQLGHIPDDSWRLLFATYLYEEICIAGLAGRSINMNPYDDSSAWRSLGEDEVQRRISRSWRKHEIDQFLAARPGVNIAYKIPDLVPILNSFLELFPTTKVLKMERSLLPTVASFLSKGWFRQGDHELMSTRVYPYFIWDGERVPYWVEAADCAWWVNAAELERCLYYYYLNMRPVPSTVTSLSYEDFVESPFAGFTRLSQELGLQAGAKTEQLLSTVHSDAVYVRNNSDQLLEDVRQALHRLPGHCVDDLSQYIPAPT